jgi:sugar/nucleoside kinase (ribokinase family)
LIVVDSHRRGLYFRPVPRIDLLTVGEGFQDLIFAGLPRLPRPGEELRTGAFVATIGGGAVITATAAARLGLKSAIVSALSEEAAASLRGDHVRVVNVRRPQELPAVSVSLSTTRDRSFVTFNGVNDRLEGRLPAAIARHPARHVHLAFAPRNCRRWIAIVNRLRKRGVTTSWDFGWNPPLRAAAGFGALINAADLVFMNEAEAALYARAHRRARNVVIKLGRRGSRWGSVSAPAPRVRAVDTTGAGDAFNGGFLTAWLEGHPSRECLRLGNFVGAQSTRAPGGIDALPTRLTRPTGEAGPTCPTRPTRR